MSSEEWLINYEGAENLAQEISELINERNSMERVGNKPSAQLQSQIRSKLQGLSRSIGSLKTGLHRETSLFTTKEADRRQHQIDTLVSKEKQLNESFRPSTQSYGNSGLYNTGFDDDHNQSSRRGGENSSNDDITPAMFRDKQAQIIKEQDSGLDELSKIIQRQKMMGKTIGEEIDYQNEIIDDISMGVDQTNQKLIKTDKHVKKVTTKSSSCTLLVVVVLLFITIIVLVAVPK